MGVKDKIVTLAKTILLGISFSSVFTGPSYASPLPKRQPPSIETGLLPRPLDQKMAYIEARSSKYTKVQNARINIFESQCDNSDSRGLGGWSNLCLACSNLEKPEYINLRGSRRELAEAIGVWQGDLFIVNRNKRAYKWISGHYLGHHTQRTLEEAFIKTQIDANIENEKIRVVELRKTQLEQRSSLVLRLTLESDSPVI